MYKICSKLKLSGESLKLEMAMKQLSYDEIPANVNLQLIFCISRICAVPVIFLPESAYVHLQRRSEGMSEWANEWKKLWCLELTKKTINPEFLFSKHFTVSGAFNSVRESHHRSSVAQQTVDSTTNVVGRSETVRSQADEIIRIRKADFDRQIDANEMSIRDMNITITSIGRSIVDLNTVVSWSILHSIKLVWNFLNLKISAMCSLYMILHFRLLVVFLRSIFPCHIMLATLHCCCLRLHYIILCT